MCVCVNWVGYRRSISLSVKPVTVDPTVGEGVPSFITSKVVTKCSVL